jgi:hypothetical protein
VNQGVHAFDAEFEFTGRPVVDNGLLRLRFIEPTGSVEAFEYDAGNDTYNQVTISQGDYELRDFDIVSLGPSRVDVFTTWENTVDNAFHELILSTQRGIAGVVLREPDNGTTPDGLESAFDPIASNQTTDARPEQTLRPRSRVRDGIFFDPAAAGAQLFATSNSNGTLVEFQPDAAFSIGTLNEQQIVDISGTNTDSFGLTFNPTGEKLFMPDISNGEVQQYSLSTPFDISTASLVNTASPSNLSNAEDIQFTSDGTAFFTTEGDEVRKFTCQSFTLDSVSFDSSYDASNEITAMDSVSFNSGGDKMYLASDRPESGFLGFNKTVVEYTLSSAFDISSPTEANTLDTQTNTEGKLDTAWNEDGSKLFVLDYNFGTSPDETYVEEYSLSTPFDTTTASFVEKTQIDSDGVQYAGISWDGSTVYSGYNS